MNNVQYLLDSTFNLKERSPTVFWKQREERELGREKREKQAKEKKRKSRGEKTGRRKRAGVSVFLATAEICIYRIREELLKGVIERKAARKNVGRDTDKYAHGEVLAEVLAEKPRRVVAKSSYSFTGGILVQKYTFMEERSVSLRFVPARVSLLSRFLGKIFRKEIFSGDFFRRFFQERFQERFRERFPRMVFLQGTGLGEQKRFGCCSF